MVNKIYAYTALDAQSLPRLLMGDPRIRTPQSPPFFPPGTFMKSVVNLILLGLSLISWEANSLPSCLWYP